MWIRDYCCLVAKCVSLSQPPWTVARQALLSMGFPRQEYWSGLPFLLQRISLPQESNLGLLCWQEPLYYWATREAHGLGIHKPKLTPGWLILLRTAGTAAPFFLNKIKWQNKVHLAFPGPVLPLTSSFRTTPSPDSLFSSSPRAGFFIPPGFWAPCPAPGQVLGLLFFLYLIQ